MVPGGRIELPTQGFSGLCSTTELPRQDSIGAQYNYTNAYFILLDGFIYKQGLLSESIPNPHWHIPPSRTHKNILRKACSVATLYIYMSIAREFTCNRGFVVDFFCKSY